MEADDRPALAAPTPVAAPDEVATRAVAAAARQVSLVTAISPRALIDVAFVIYAAARLAIEPDTLQERQFLKMLAEALDVPPDAVARLDRALAA